MSEENVTQFQNGYLDAMRQGSGRMADKVIEAALENEVSANDIYLEIMQNTAYEIGRMWQRNEFSVAQEHLATAIIERQMGDLHPYFKPLRDRAKRIIFGAVDKELHRVGMRMVADFFEQDGWEVYYLGATVPTDTFLAAAREFQADLIGLSAQMVYHLPAILDFVREADRRGMQGIPIIAGGYPFVQNPGLFQSLGVRFGGANARDALANANQIIQS